MKIENALDSHGPS